MTRRLVAPDNGVALVVQQGHEVVGHGLLELVDETWTFRLLIQDTHADGNLGNPSRQAAASHAKGNGADRLTLVTAESNDKLLRAVGNAGFMARIERRDGSVHISVPLSAVRAMRDRLVATIQAVPARRTDHDVTCREVLDVGSLDDRERRAAQIEQQGARLLGKGRAGCVAADDRHGPRLRIPRRHRLRRC